MSRPSGGFAWALLPRHLLVEVEIGRGGTGNQSGPEAEREILDGPLDEDRDATAELNKVGEVDERPDEPGGESGEMQTEGVGHRGGPADDGQLALVEILERGQRRPALDRSDDRP